VLSDNLSHFLIDLASDSDRMAAFLVDPAGALAGSLLTDEEKAAVLTRDTARVRAALGRFSLAMAEPVAVMKKRPIINPRKDRKTDDPPEPVASKQRKPGSTSKRKPAARKGGRKSSKKK
jgi:hypothetical protein